MMKFLNKHKLRKAGEAALKLLHSKELCKELHNPVSFENKGKPDKEILKMLDAIPESKKKSKPKPETKIVKECLDLLKKSGMFAWRNNTGAVQTSTGFYRFGMPGQADITGLLRDGRRLEIEVKSLNGKQSAVQAAFQNKIEASNGIYILCHSVEELYEQLARFS